MLIGGLGQADSSVTDPAVAAELKKKRTFRSFSYRGIELDKLLDLSNEEVRDAVMSPKLQLKRTSNSSSRYAPTCQIGILS